MVRSFINLFKKSRFAVLGVVLLLSVGAAATVELIQPNTPTSAAVTCDKVNVIYCGLKGSALSGYVSSFKSYYKSGSDGRYNDLKADYRWAGATDASVAAMNTSNTKMGTLYRNGDIKVNGKVVGTDAWISARFGAGQTGFVRVPNTANIWARKTTTSMAEASTPVIVHFNSTGQVDFAVMVTCGNSVKVKPIPPKPVLVCENLTYTGPVDSRVFTATAKADHTTITKYVFNFGDGKTQTVTTSKSSAKSNAHNYTQAGHKYTASVKVYSKDFPNGVTSANCQKSFSTPPAASLTCDLLTVEPNANSNSFEYTFNAQATAQHTTITKYVFSYGDKTKDVTVPTSKDHASSQHTYAKPGDYKASVKVYAKGFNGVSGPRCNVTVHVPKSPKSPQLICEALSDSLVANSDKPFTYNFIANASATHTTITKYVFNFGDKSSKTVNTSATQAETTHSYANNTQDYTATVTVYAKDIQGGVSAKNCQVTIPKAPQKCVPCTPTTTSGKESNTNCEQQGSNSTMCQPTNLPNTGAGNIIGLFGATSVAAGLLHRVILRRKYVG